ncbi:cellulose binding domain-containing protein [Streptomyces sp. NPDC088387]|uniref:cellulose binding domain-containing protein n=1 Tax=Streptomyces sp. NPDC088387 TaxID=3365859 RepID=UPI003813357D
MPDLPIPQDTTEAAEFDESWDTVLSYADLCTAGSDAAMELATEAFAYGIREIRTGSTGRGVGRRWTRLPRIPLLLTAVRDTAADWETRGQGHRLDPDLRLWLNSGNAARYSGPPQQRPLALRSLEDMHQPDAALLWLAEVEAVPLPVLAGRLGLDPAGIAEELVEVRGLFRDRCLRNHLDRPMDTRCRSYARLLEAVTRTPVADTPDDLSRHLARCVGCAEAAACLRLHGGGLPAALAGGVLGWGGLAYLERRRRAAEVRGAVGGPGASGTARRTDPRRTRALRGGLLAGAVAVSVVALAVSLLPLGGGDGDTTDRADGDGRVPIADSDTTEALEPAEPSEAPRPATASTGVSPRPTATPSGSTGPSREPDAGTDPEPQPQGTSTTTAAGNPPPRETTRPDTTCQVSYDVVSEWPSGFQAVVKVTTEEALDDWSLGWRFRDGQRVSQMWDARVEQNGSRVTARAYDYNRSVGAGASLTFGFLGSWDGENSPAHDFTLNGDDCRTS